MSGVEKGDAVAMGDLGEIFAFVYFCGETVEGCAGSASAAPTGKG